MRFEYPNILYALFALIIPIIVHLFQFRKFKKTLFTNVKFLQQLVVKNRKSSTIKKWLVLITRLCAFTCIILAFCKPYFDKNNSANTKTESVFYIDNSFSMKAKGEKGELLKANIIELLENFNEDEKLTVITNSKVFRETNLSKIKNDLIKLEYTSKQNDLNTTLLKSNTLFSKEQDVKRNLYLVSDFQDHLSLDSTFFNTSYNINCIQTKPIAYKNISLDSAYFTSNQIDKTTLNIIVKNQNSTVKSIPISIYDNEKLINKTSCQLTKLINSVAIDFTNDKPLNLRISISTDDLNFDNDLFISKSKPKPVSVLAIGQISKSKYLKKLYSNKEFTFKAVETSDVDYSIFKDQGLIILNEIDNYSSALIQNISNYIKDGGYIIYIPNTGPDLKLLNTIGLKGEPILNNDIRLTKINYSHPLLSNVFERQVSNFNYPKFTSHFKYNTYSSSILTLENGNPLLVNKGQVYAFSSSINQSNFTQSSLIVPIFYNIGKKSSGLDAGYYNIGQNYNIPITASLSKDNVLSLHKGDYKHIPLQTIKAKSVVLNTNELPEQAGNYMVKAKDTTTLKTLSYNYNRQESILQYKDLNSLGFSNVTISNSLEKTIQNVISANEIKSLWKWFVIFAALFLVIELLILKYFK